MRSWLTMLGIFIGIASEVALIGLGQGLEKAILGEFASIGTDKIMIQASGGFGPPGSSAISELSYDDLKVVKSVNGLEVVTQKDVKSVKGTYQVEDATSMSYEAGKLKFNEKVIYPFVMAQSFDSDLFEEFMATMGDLESGRPLQALFPTTFL